jgi:hypothetical protein
VVGVDADLLDVRGPVDDIEQEIAERPIPGVDRDKCPAVLAVRRKLLDRTGIVVGDGVHAEGTERLARSAFDLDEQRKLVRARHADHDLAHYHNR